jgi:uncharacterized protein (TIGR03435 family)
MTSSRYPLLAILAIAGAFPASALDSFAVASVKLSANQNPIPGQGGLGPPIPSKPVASLSIDHATLQGMLSRAYSLRITSIVGPGWIESAYYDVNAKVPPGAGREKIAEMLRNLLTQRFDLRVRLETRIVDGWALVAGPLPLKLTPTSLPVDPADSDPEGVPGRNIRFGVEGAQMKITAKGDSMEGLAKLIVGELDEPVQDKTGVKGVFDFTLQGEKTNPAEMFSHIDAASVKRSLRPYGLDLVRQKGEKITLHVDSGNKNPKPN